MSTPLWLKSPVASAAVGTVSTMESLCTWRSAFIIDEEERLARMPDRPTDRTSEVILDKKIGAAHLVEGVRIQGAVPQKLIGGSVEAAGSRARDDVDLPSTGASHLGGIAARLDLELLHRIGEALRFCVLKVGSVLVAPSSRK